MKTLRMSTLRNIALTIISSFALLAFTPPTFADAIVRSEAMFATTIAEYLIDDKGITLNLEIGLNDVESFKNLMPDEIYEKLGNPPKPLRERLRYFFETDFIVIADDGPPLVGRVTNISAEERVRRDAITGEPIPTNDQQPEIVINVRISYAWSVKPESLTFGFSSSGPQASIGFVAYHENIAVNDFRYLTRRQVLSLDWEDPWYSAFEGRALRRSNFAPMSGFIYVEPYEVRKEIVFRPKDLQDWVDLGIDGQETIPVSQQDELKRVAAAFLKERQQVIIDGEIIEPDLARINFLERTLRTSRVIDPPVDLAVNAAIMGVIFVYATVEALPQKVTMEWDLFNDRIQQVPAAAVDQAGPLPTFLEPDYAILEWQNFLTNPDLPTLEVVASPPNALAATMVNARWILLVFASLILGGCLLRVRRADAHPAVPILAVTLATGVAGWGFWLGQTARLTDDAAESVVAGLLHNIYRSFDFREEYKIYDVLEKSVEGDLLTQIYLETQRSLELSNQGGARAKVKAIEVVDFSQERRTDGAFVAATTWNVAGSVGHWGHIHERKNQYQAVLDIRPVNGEWKLVGLEILREERL
jgi:hypothetical protein